MEDVKEKKQRLRKETEARIAGLTQEQMAGKKALVEKQLLEFANFQEAETVLFYIGAHPEFDPANIIAGCPRLEKEVVLPLFDLREIENTQLLKITSLETDLRPGPDGSLEPDPERCKPVAYDSIDIAIVPGIAFDEKGGRLGKGTGRYDRLIPLLPITARKVALALEEQMFSLIPTEPHDKSVDIIITEKRVIYKI